MTAERTPEGPLDLRGLMDVESPDVVRTALRRFRRRLLGWALVVVLVVAGFIGLRFFTTPRYLPDRLATAPGEQVGRVVHLGSATMVVLEARRIGDERYGLRLVLTADGLEDNERLTVGPGLTSCIDDAAAPLDPTRPTPTPHPPTLASVFSQPGQEAVEAWVSASPGVGRLPIEIGAIRGTRATTARAPSRPFTLECGSLMLSGIQPPGRDLRLLEAPILDLQELGISEWIWEEDVAR